VNDVNDMNVVDALVRALDVGEGHHLLGRTMRTRGLTLDDAAGRVFARSVATGPRAIRRPAR
jgi:hypothetical protein